MKPYTKDPLQRVGELTEGPVARLVIVGLLLVIVGVVLGRIVNALNVRAYHPRTIMIDLNVG